MCVFQELSARIGKKNSRYPDVLLERVLMLNHLKHTKR